MIPLIIDKNIREQIKQVMKYAYNNIVPIKAMSDSGALKRGDVNPIGNNDLHVVYIPTAFKVVYSIEDQGEGDRCLGLVRHLSMSIADISKVPHFVAVDMTIQEFGFNSPIYECILWGENFGDGTQTAVNVIEPIKGWPDKEIPNQLKNDFEEKFGKDIIYMIDQRRGIIDGRRAN